MVMFRKTLLSAVLVFIKHTFLQSFTATCVMFCALCLHFLYMPYDDGLLNRLELVSILSTLVTQFLGILFYFLETDDMLVAEWKSTILGAVLVVVNVDIVVDVDVVVERPTAVAAATHTQHTHIGDGQCLDCLIMAIMASIYIDIEYR